LFKPVAVAEEMSTVEEEVPVELVHLIFIILDLQQHLIQV
jgi:hypothetical protein